MRAALVVLILGGSLALADTPPKADDATATALLDKAGKGDKAGKNHLVHTVVFLNLKQKMSVTGFETVTECKGE